MKRVVVLGAGISGLTAAFDLLRAGCDVRVVEATDRAGGCIGTTRRGAYRFDNGVSSIQGDSQHFRSLCQDAGIGHEIVESAPASRERYLYYHSRLMPLPRSFRDFVKTPLFTGRQKARVLLEPLVRRGHPDREETVAEFFGRRVGRAITMTWVDVVVSGTYAGNPNRLGIRSAFPALARMEMDHGSIFKSMNTKARARRQADGTVAGSTLLSLREGLEQLPIALRKVLGDRMIFGRRVRGLRRRREGGVTVETEGAGGANETIDADRIVVAVPAPVAGILLAPLATEVADLLFEIESASLVVAQAAFAKDGVPGLPPGFGFLVPRCMRMRTLGWIFASQLFPGGAPEDKVLLNGFVGGILDPRAVELDDGALGKLLIGELALALGQRKNPVPEVIGFVRWRDVLPQYNVGHSLRIAAARKLLEIHVPEISLAGNWVSGISVDSCIARAREAAAETLATR